MTDECHSQIEMDRIHICGIFQTIRVIQGQHGLTQSRFKTNESTVLTSKVASFSSLYVKIQTIRNKIKGCQCWGAYWCVSFSLVRIRCLWFEMLLLLSNSLSKVNVSERWSSVDDAQWMYGLVSVRNASFGKDYINLESANMVYWLYNWLLVHVSIIWMKQSTLRRTSESGKTPHGHKYVYS